MSEALLTYFWWWLFGLIAVATGLVELGGLLCRRFRKPKGLWLEEFEKRMYPAA